MATLIKRRAQGRVQHLDFLYNGIRVLAARYRISSNQYTPWLITMGEHSLPASHVSRGRLLSKLFTQTA